MEKLVILRMFFCFPLVGLLLPDVVVLLSNYTGYVPLIHVGIEVGLIVCILLCTLAIYAKKRSQNLEDKAKEASFM